MREPLLKVGFFLRKIDMRKPIAPFYSSFFKKISLVSSFFPKHFMQVFLKKTTFSNRGSLMITYAKFIVKIIDNIISKFN